MKGTKWLVDYKKKAANSFDNLLIKKKKKNQYFLVPISQMWEFAAFPLLMWR